MNPDIGHAGTGDVDEAFAAHADTPERMEFVERAQFSRVDASVGGHDHRQCVSQGFVRCRHGMRHRFPYS
jgi:hypothetical protein